MNNPAAEATVLGAVLLNNAVWPQVAALSSSDFSLAANGTIFARMRDLCSAGMPIDMITLIPELERHTELEAVGGPAYISSLVDCVPERSDIRFHVEMVRSYACARYIARTADAISELALQPGRPDILALRGRIAELDRGVAEYEDGGRLIRRYKDIPDIMELAVNPISWLVDGMFARKTLTLWAGADGTGKTYLAMKLAIAVGQGSQFLNRQCAKSSVLYLDYENPDHEIQARLLKMAGGSVPGLKTWGPWLSQPPPAIGDPLLLSVAEEVQPLIIIDPFRYAHDADENDSTEMTPIMRYLRSLASAGATVIVLHHPAKAEGSSGRGSSVIRGAVDVAYLQEMSEQTGLITMRCVKNRLGPKPVITIRPDFQTGQFDVVDSPGGTQGEDDTDRIAKAITDNPGITQIEIIKRVAIGRTKASNLLRANDGSLWQSKPGPKQSLRYFPVGCTAVPVQTSTDPIVVPLYPPLKGGTAVQPRRAEAQMQA